MTSVRLQKQTEIYFTSNRYCWEKTGCIYKIPCRLEKFLEKLHMGKTHGKTFCALLNFFSACIKGPPHLRRRRSWCNDRTKEKMWENLEWNKAYDKMFTWRTASCGENRRQEKENKMALEISRHDRRLRHGTKFSLVCAFSAAVKSLLSCMYCSNLNLLSLNNETLCNWLV